MRMEDSWGDPIEVYVVDDEIFVEGDGVANLAFTPKKARKLAWALVRAAEKAEAGS